MSTNNLAPEARPHAFTKAQEIAKALGADWNPVDRDSQWIANIHGPDLRSLTLNMGTWRNGRLTIMGSAERLQRKYSDPRVSSPNLGVLPSISVDPNKDGEMIAKDINRRLLGEYEAFYILTLQNFEALRLAIAERMSTVEELSRLTGGKHHDAHNYPFCVYAGVNLDVDGADSIRFSHTVSFTLDQMRRLITAVPELFR